MPLKSKAQNRFMWAAEARGELPEGTAREWVEHTPNIKALPEKVKQEKPKTTKLKHTTITKPTIDYHQIMGTKSAAGTEDMYSQPSGLPGLSKLYENLFGTSTKRKPIDKQPQDRNGDVFQFSQALRPKTNEDSDQQIGPILQKVALAVLSEEQLSKLASGGIKLPGATSAPTPIKATNNTGPATNTPPAVSTLRGTKDPNGQLAGSAVNTLRGTAMAGTQALGGSPSANPINSYGPISLSGNINGNAGLGVANSQVPSKFASILDEDTSPVSTGRFLTRDELLNYKPKPKPEIVDREDCPHCGAMHERGDNGNCNRCGKDWPAKSAMSAEEIDELAGKAVEPKSDAQREAGNYQKGHIKLHGLDISIENPKGSTRCGINKEGKSWESTLTAHYGYIKRTLGADGDHVDIFIGPDTHVELVHVIDQINPDTGKLDEHKCLIGCASQAEAKDLYHSNYHKNWKGFGGIKSMHIDDFHRWLASGKTDEPITKEANDYIEEPPVGVSR